MKLEKPLKVKETRKDIYDVDGLLDERFGKSGTEERAEAEKKAQEFYESTIMNGEHKNE